ncbi:Bgt-20743, partial [Blumeria graminis f. sp. tritici]
CSNENLLAIYNTHSARAVGGRAIENPEFEFFFKHQKSVHKSPQGLIAVCFTSTS